MTDTSGIDKAREVAAKIKGTVKTEEETQQPELTLARVEVQGVQVGADVAEFYKRNARVGVENISRDTLPTLKVTESNSKGELANGNRPKVGYFYYTKTQTEFKEVEVSLMSVSRGFYVAALKKGDDPKFQQIVSGMILETMEPFIMYVSGKRLNPLWELGKELSPFTKHKEIPVPMMAFRILLSTTNYKHEYGDSHYINFKVVRDDKNQVQLITDMGALEVIRGGIEAVEEAVASIIEATAVDKNTGELIKDKPTQAYQNAEEALIDSEDVPF